MVSASFLMKPSGGMPLVTDLGYLSRYVKRQIHPFWPVKDISQDMAPYVKYLVAQDALQIFIVIILCKSIKVIGEMYKLMVGKLFCKNYLEI